jgi:tetrathionate reductase subunit B
MGKVLIIDITKCNGCHNCQIACKDEHVGNDWSPIAKPQPETGHFWTKVEDLVRGSVPKVKVAYTHKICRHCDDAPCIKACPNQAIYKRADGIVIIDPVKCKGSKICIQECPYEGSIYFNDTLNIAQKCTFCAHLIDKNWGETRCSDACPTGAFAFGDEEELKDRIPSATDNKTDLQTRPRVYFSGIPKRFIGGLVFDPNEDEVVIGADIEIVNTANGKSISIKTDEFGDFWIDGLAPGSYDVHIQKNGYIKKELNVDIREKDINLGDIAVQMENR